MPKPRFQNPTIKQNKNGSYFIRVWEDYFDEAGELQRRKQTIVLGTADIGKRGAIAKKTEVMGPINRGAYVIQSAITVGEFVAIYQADHVVRQSASTQAKYESHLKNHVLPAFKDLKLSHVTTLLIDSWLGSKECSGMGYETRKDLRNLMSGIFSKAADWGYWKGSQPG